GHGLGQNGGNRSGHSRHPDLSDILDTVIGQAQHALLKKQNVKEGYWSVPLRADTTLESDTITLYAYMGWLEKRKKKVQQLANTILSQQMDDGGWNIYRNGPSEISATVKSYWALKIAGHSPDSPVLLKARKRIVELGGIHKVNSYSKFYMALFGLYDWRGVPAIPPELMLFPKWFYFNIYEMSAWTRGIVIPLSIVWARKPKKSLPPRAHLEELFDPTQPKWSPVGSSAPVDEGIFSWRKFFLGWDSFFKMMEGKGPHFLRTWSLRLAKKWMIDHFQDSDGLGAIFPPIVNAILALDSLGYPEDHPYLQGQLKALEEYEILHPENDALEMQPCLAPIWDTALSVIALAESGLRRDHPALVKGVEWLIKNEVQREGDWRVKNPTSQPGGWAFEFKNDFYPDVDDTSMVLLALRLAHFADDPMSQSREKAYLRGLNWMLSMQCTNGGWAAFDRDNIKFIFEKIPFADHNAMIDPPSVDITGRVLELLGYVGYDKSFACVQKALDFIRREQTPDGSWYGRWGVNYIYGTWQVLRGLSAIGEDMNSAYVQKAARWLKSVQNPDGGWGERCDTYEDSSRKGKGPSTPSQTAWGLMALLACGLIHDSSVEKAAQHLLSTQNPDGTWDETEFTGTGFPRVFYLEYTLYRDYFPLLALGIYRNKMIAIGSHRRVFPPDLLKESLS
ncbi:MAG: squalene--hopene cyclase, partial [Elusimicrobia bacterium]|nr:squalene--hopene cyclase [Elusimicrobiota bacterium]